MPEFDFLLCYDPGPYPLARGAELSVLDVAWGLRLGSFTPGTVLYEQQQASLHTVRQGDGYQYLDPPCERVDSSRRPTSVGT